MGGHSRRCAQLAADAAQVLGLHRRLRRALAPRGARPRLRHDGRPELDLGQARPAHARGVRPGRAASDADRADAAPLTCSRRPEPGRAAHHEKGDGSGYHKRVPADGDDLGACVLAATEIYVGMTTERADRPAFPPTRRRRRAAPARVRGRARASRQTAPCWWPRGTASRGARPGQAAARTRAGSPVARSTCCSSRRAGYTTREIADRLFISPKTADHHIQHIYGKIGVSTRAAAALWAMQHAVVQ